ncbi:D-aminoacyl-tRNA deacylase-like [Mytilus californianus]|uniref:D-aminoacyl-tRNA deacylase-like n=1 Tax=Mytilus californianus TaxID=6549 RepID=UPI002245A7D3|nr:D-aminoacyl-tRNA deacylase-like [Mytilus californianus]
MKAIIQRVMQASVTVDGEVINSIGKGLCVLVGITRKDKAGEMDYLAKKIVNIRLWDDEVNGKKWDKSVKDLGYEILCISQFTLALEMKGNKPDFHDAMNPEYSEPFYNDFLDLMRSMYKPEKVKGGVFGGYMQIHIQNDGPITIPLDTPSSLQDPNFLLKQERKQEAARKRDQRSKNNSESKNSDKKSSTVTSQEPPSEIQETSDSLKNVSLSQEET